MASGDPSKDKEPPRERPLVAELQYVLAAAFLVASLVGAMHTLFA